MSLQVDFEKDSRFVEITGMENSTAFSVEPDIYCDEPKQDQHTAFVQVLQWIRNGNNPRAKEIRLQAAFYFFSGGSKLSNLTQVTLAKEIGSTKAAISQKAVELQDYFAERLGLKDTMERVSIAAGMRSSEARQKFSQVCKSNHQKKKACSNSDTSRKTSTASSVKQSGLRERVLKAGNLQ